MGLKTSNCLELPYQPHRGVRLKVRERKQQFFSQEAWEGVRMKLLIKKGSFRIITAFYTPGPFYWFSSFMIP